MKKTLLTLAVATCAVSLLAQGTVAFNTRNTAAIPPLFVPVYGPEAGNTAVSKTGQSAAGQPAGTQVYTGALLTGSGWTAQLWSANTGGQAESSLLAANNTSTFRTGTSAGGIAAITSTLTGVPKDAPVATMQIRVWNNLGGTITTWAQAEALWLSGTNPTYAIGKSALWNLNLIGGDFNSPPLPYGAESFNVFTSVPEPSTFVLAGLGAAGLLIFRRRK